MEAVSPLIVWSGTAIPVHLNDVAYGAVCRPFGLTEDVQS